MSSRSQSAFQPLLAVVARDAGQAALSEDALRCLDAFGPQVAQRRDPRALDVGEALHGAGAAHAQSDEARADDGNRVDGELQDRALARGTGGFVEDDRAVDRPVAGIAAAGGREQRGAGACKEGESLHGSVGFRV